MNKCFFCQRVVIEGVDDITRRGDAFAHRRCLSYIREQYEFLKGWIEEEGGDGALVGASPKPPAPHEGTTVYWRGRPHHTFS